jgi:hypothetical protein
MITTINVVIGGLTMATVGIYWWRFGVNQVDVVNHYRSFDGGFPVVSPLWTMIVSYMILFSPVMFTLTTVPIFVTNCIENLKLIFTMEVERTPWFLLVPAKCLFLVLAVLPGLLLKDFVSFLTAKGVRNIF